MEFSISIFISSHERHPEYSDIFSISTGFIVFTFRNMARMGLVQKELEQSITPKGIRRTTKSDANAPPPGKVCIRSTAEVLRGADVDAKTAEKLGAFHVWSEEFVRARDKWMPEKPMRAIFLKVNTIKPVEIENISEYSGCRSWLDINIDIENSMQVLDSTKLASELEKFEDIVS